MGIGTVAVYSDVDRTALHVLMADEAVSIGPAPAAESYLVGDKIIGRGQGDRRRGHPSRLRLPVGERRLLPGGRRRGLVFIGPTAESMEVMGDKLSARRKMRASGVPVVPGTDEAVTDPDVAIGIAEEIGYPVLLKASAGGGGKGMRDRARSRRDGQRPAPDHGRSRAAPSATTPSSWRSTSRTPSTSRCRCWATARARRSTSSSASARCSGATRRSSRNAPPPR